MAKITSEVLRFDLRSRRNNACTTVMQRRSFRLERVDGRYVRTPLQTELIGERGETFEMIPGALRCVESGEEFAVLGVTAKAARGEPAPQASGAPRAPFGTWPRRP